MGYFQDPWFESLWRWAFRSHSSHKGWWIMHLAGSDVILGKLIRTQTASVYPAVGTYNSWTWQKDTEEVSLSYAGPWHGGWIPSDPGAFRNCYTFCVSTINVPVFSEITWGTFQQHRQIGMPSPDFPEGHHGQHDLKTHTCIIPSMIWKQNILYLNQNMKHYITTCKASEGSDQPGYLFDHDQSPFSSEARIILRIFHWYQFDQ